jgi:hypothetical protein
MTVESFNKLEIIFDYIDNWGHLVLKFYNLTANYCPVFILIAENIYPNDPSDIFLIILYFDAISIYIMNNFIIICNWYFII